MAKIISVPGIHCENCVKRISASLDETGVKYSVSLEERTVAIDGCENCVAKAVEAIEDAGFEAIVK
ncbi:MAG: heavy-metal-associated domain-containing protein [Oscillospiraceae bacterium]|nr:heavy-metal-associated domain-containing protein [Oscillospiraceae bacterium]